MTLPTLTETIAAAVPDLSSEQKQTLVDALIQRENTMADMFRMAGMQFGLYPQIVAEVFAEVGIGTPVDESARTFIRQQYVALMEELQRQHGGQS